MLLLRSAFKIDIKDLHVKILRDSNMCLKYNYIIFEHAKASHNILTKFNKH